jgi:hypothetical protein
MRVTDIRPSGMTQQRNLVVRGREKGEAEDAVGLTWRDYLALFVAAVETVGLPLLIFMLVVIVLLVITRFLR